MGMFDYVKFEMKCPKCGANVDDFQSKDGPCCLLTLEYWEVDRFYSSCDACHAWLEYRRKRGQSPISDYELLEVA